MDEKFSQDRYIVRRKFWQFLGATVYVETPEAQQLLNAKLKAFKLREDIRLYADAARTKKFYGLAPARL